MAAVNTVDNDVVYITARRDSDQKITSGTWGGKNIIMNVKRGSGIQYDTDTGIFTLEKDTAYRVTAQLGWQAKTPEYYQFGLFNVNTNEQIGTAAEALPPNRNSCNASGGLLDVIFMPPDTGDYYLKMMGNVKAGASSVIRADVDTFLNIAPVTTPCLSAKRLTSQTLPSTSRTWKSVPIIFDDVIFKSGVEYKDGFFTLEEGKSYRITAQLGWEAKTPEFYQFGLFNSDTKQQFGPAAEALPPNRNTSNASGGVLDIVITPLKSVQYYLSMTSSVTAGASSKIRADVSTFLNVVEVPASKSFLSTRYFKDATFSWLDKYVIKMNINTQHGDIAYFPAHGVFTLQGGKAYRITAQVGWRASTPRYYQIILRTHTLDQQIGPIAEALPPNRNTCNASSGLLDVIHVPFISGDYTLAIVSDTDGCSARGDVSTFLNIVEL